MTSKATFIFLLIFLTQLSISQPQSLDNISMAIIAKFDAVIVKHNKQMALPHRVICRPIKLSSDIIDEAQLEGLLLSFIEENRDLFGIDPQMIQKRSIHKVEKNWYAEFYQLYDSKEVLNSEIIFRVNENGNLFMFGLDYYEGIAIESINKVTKSAILEYLKSNYESRSQGGITYDFRDDYILPIWEKGKCVFKSVQLVLITDQDKLSEFVYVNHYDGNIEKSLHKCLHGNVLGSCTANILPTIATEDQIVRALPFLNINVDGEQISSDENGGYDFLIPSSSATLEARLRGKYVSLQNFSGADAKIEMEVNCDEEFSLIWDDSNSTIAERNAYYHINKMHEYNKEIDANFVGLDYPLQCIVNDNSAFCNAYWNGNNLHFNTQDVNCSMNSAHGASVIYHEYGHAVNDRLYNQIGYPWGMKNPILQEAFSDIYSTLLLNDSRFALGWYGPGTMTRNLNNFNRYPSNVVGQQHTDGLILGGAFWDLGQLTTPETAYRLSHLAKYGAPDDEDLAVAFTEVLVETLVADDEDGNLMNGSPNSQAIQEAFCNHGIGLDLLISQKLLHNEHPNTVNTNDEYRISVNLPQLNLSNDYDHLTLVYSTDNFNSQQRIKMEEEDGFEHVGFIPSMSEGALVKYYFEVLDSDCNSTYYHPSQKYRSEYYSFLVGVLEKIFEDNFEENMGWILFNSSDNATAGRWQRGAPQEVINEIGQLVSPGNDNSEVGEKCLVTGVEFGNIWYSNDVDGGMTTVTSPVFGDINDHSVFEFYKWFTHGSGFIFPAQGLWKLQISNNGLNWVTIEQTAYGDHRYWIKGMYRFSDFVDITDQVQVRFEVSDFGQGSIVEGLIDDFKIYNFSEMTSILNENSKYTIEVFPNPSSSIVNIRYSEKPEREITIAVFSIDGKRVKVDTLIKANNVIQLDVSKLKSGIYILKCKSRVHMFSQRIVVI